MKENEREERQQQRAFRIDDKYYLVIDRYNWAIAKFKRKRKGKVEYNFISFHSDFEKAIKKYLEIKTEERHLNGGENGGELVEEALTNYLIELSEFKKKLVKTAKSLEKLITYQSDK